MMIRPHGFTSLLALVLVCAGLSGCAPHDIWQATNNGNYNRVKQLIDENPGQAVAVHEPDKWTPLHYAADQGHEKLVRLLLDHGADPLAPARGNWTPLHAAKANQRQAVVRMLEKAIVDSGRELP